MPMTKEEAKKICYKKKGWPQGSSCWSVYVRYDIPESLFATWEEFKKTGPLTHCLDKSPDYWIGRDWAWEARHQESMSKRRSEAAKRGAQTRKGKTAIKPTVPYNPFDD